MTVGERIRQARKEAGLTQKQLADKLGISPVNISQIENGRGKRGPAAATLRKIATALNITVSDLLSDNAFRKYVQYEGLAQDIKDELLSECMDPEEYEEIKSLTIAEIQEGLLANDYQNTRLQRLYNLFLQLNEIGQLKAIDWLSDLVKIPKYQKE